MKAARSGVPADISCGFNRSMSDEEDEDMKKNKECDEDKVEAKAEEAVEQEEEQKEVCPECGKDPCECEDKKKECDEDKVEEKEEEEATTESEEAKEEESSDEDEIRSLGDLVNMRALADEFIAQKRSLDDFKKEIKSKSTLKEEIKMQKFSLRKALLNATGRLSDEQAAYEREVIAENKRKFNINDADIVLSVKELRDFDGTEALNQTVYQPGLYTPVLRPAVTVDAIGTRKVAVTGPSISFSVCTSGLNAGYVDLNGNVPSANMDFALKSMTPHKVGAYCDISYQSLLQDDPSAEGIVLDDITKALNQAKDAAFFNGLSGNNEPVGLLNAADINEVTLPATPTLSTALEFEKKIRESYDYSGDLKWVMGTEAYYKWASTPYSATAQNEMLLNADTRKCIGYDVFVDASLPTSAVILGNFDEALEADFDGIAIRIVEDATLARKQALEIVAHAANDFLFRRPKSFCKGV